MATINKPEFTTISMEKGVSDTLTSVCEDIGLPKTWLITYLAYWLVTQEPNRVRYILQLGENTYHLKQLGIEIKYPYQLKIPEDIGRELRQMLDGVFSPDLDTWKEVE